MTSRLNYIRLLPRLLEKAYQTVTDSLRYWFFFPAFKKIGFPVHISRNVSFGGIYNIEIGNSVSVNQGCNLYGDFGISIGDNTKLSPYVQLYSANYKLKRGHELGSLGVRGKKIVIGKNVWIGAGSIILSGVTIGDNCVVGAGSVVKTDIPSNEMWSGNPAMRVIKR